MKNQVLYSSRKEPHAGMPDRGDFTETVLTGMYKTQDMQLIDPPNEKNIN